MHLLLDILDNMCIVMICFLVDDVINVDINLSFLINLFFYIARKVKKSDYINNKRSFLGEIKSIFLSFLKDFQLARLIQNWESAFNLYQVPSFHQKPFEIIFQ